MPTIARPRTPFWRKKTLHGYDVELLKTQKNIDLECDIQWQKANLDERTREILIKRDLTAWFVRLPGEKRTFGTLIEFCGYHRPNNREFRLAVFDGGIPLTTGDNPQLISEYTRFVSIFEGVVALYGNKSPDHLWSDLRQHMEWKERLKKGADPADHPPEDWDAFKDA